MQTNDTQDTLLLIPAAGVSSRMMGRDKLLEEVDGQPLLYRQVARALATGCPVLVTIAQDRPERAQALRPLAQNQLSVAMIDGRDGMSVSLREGAREALARNARAMMVVLPDMPDLETTDLAACLEQANTAPNAVWRATSERGEPGHPVILPARLFENISALQGDSGARALLKEEQAQLVTLPGARAITDLDTPQDWQHWRKGQR